MIQGLSATLLWVITAVVLGAIEAITVGLVTIWFAVGAVIAMVFALIGLSVVWQIIVFVISSVVLLVFTRPLMKDFLRLGREKTNADQLTGETAVVIQKVNNIQGIGQVKIKGQIWSALSSDGNEIDIDSKVVIKGITGVKLIVAKMENQQ